MPKLTGGALAAYALGRTMATQRDHVLTPTAIRQLMWEALLWAAPGAVGHQQEVAYAKACDALADAMGPVLGREWADAIRGTR